MTVLWPVAERNLSSLWCCAASIYSNSRKKDGELNNTVSHIVFPLTSLLLGIALSPSPSLSLKVNGMESPHSGQNSLSLSLLGSDAFRASEMCVLFIKETRRREAAVLLSQLVCLLLLLCTCIWRRLAQIINTTGGDTRTRVGFLQSFFLFARAIVTG